MSGPNSVNNGTPDGMNILPERVKQWVYLLHLLSENFRRINLLGQAAIALLGLIFALFNVYQWEKRSTDLSKRIESSLAAKLDNTVWQHKGLAAYLLSDIETAPTPDKGLAAYLRSFIETPPTPAPPANTPALEPISLTNTTKVIELIQEQQPRPGEAEARAAAGQGANSEDIKEVTQMVEELLKVPESRPSAQPNPNPTPSPYLEGLLVTNDTPSDGVIGPVNQAVIAGGERFFLFLPATALRRPGLNYDSLNVERLKPVLINNPDIVLDLSLAMRLIGELEKFDGKGVQNLSVVQSYFITEAGLILIRSSRSSNQLHFYQQYFDTNHNFTDRAYFWDAIKALKKQGGENNPLAAPFAYVSEPYIDLGGHGLIKTYSKAFRLRNGRYGVLCVDAEAPPSLRGEVEIRLNALKPDDATNTFEVKNFPLDQKGNVIQQRLPPDFEWFSQKLANENTKKASLLGRIVAEDAKSGDVHRYTIPWSRSLRNDGYVHVELMLVRINLNQFWNKQGWRIAYICFGLAVFFAVTINIVQDYRLLKRRISGFAETVDEVMTLAINPYVRLNSENEFVSMNDSFLELLGYSNDADLKNENTAQTRTFRSLLEPESQREYEKILKTSRGNLNNDEYSITLLKRSEEGKKREKVRVLVHGESIGFPAIRRRKYPHRFGIVLGANQVDDSGEETPIQLGKRVAEHIKKRMGEERNKA